MQPLKVYDLYSSLTYGMLAKLENNQNNQQGYSYVKADRVDQNLYLVIFINPVDAPIPVKVILREPVPKLYCKYILVVHPY